ncbi:MAG TPA: pyrroloquinoline quinone biosynthesis protein PqqB, partial [Flavobacteriaceae bacterium]|nr:pyrroloquinoline quinone biosynthesis protein PqqB [Flavobacteriaceae bacterium]
MVTSGQSILINSKAQQFITVLGVAQDGGYPQAGCT